MEYEHVMRQIRVILKIEEGTSVINAIEALKASEQARVLHAQSLHQELIVERERSERLNERLLDVQSYNEALKGVIEAQHDLLDAMKFMARDGQEDAQCR